MRYALVLGGSVERELLLGHPFTDANGDANPPENLTYGLTDVQRAERGVLPIVSADAAPEGQQVASLSLALVGAVVVESAVYEAIPLGALKSAKLESAANTYAAKLAIGYPVTLGGNAETLQCRNEHDRTNWLGLLAGAQAGVAAGAGAANYPIKIRATSNAEYTVTNAEAVSLMFGILGWAGGVLAAYWAVKDAITEAGNTPTLNAVDIEAGYP